MEEKAVAVDNEENTTYQGITRLFCNCPPRLKGKDLTCFLAYVIVSIATRAFY